jgi:hypothetical protein
MSFAGAEVSGVSLASEEVAGMKVSGTVLEGEAVVFFFFFFLGVGRTGGSVRSASSLPAPMLLAPVSSTSGGEVKSSFARGFGDLGAARPELAFPPRGEARDFPAPEGTGLD